MPHGFCLANPKVCEAILCNYSKLKEHSYGNFEGDLYYLIMSFEEVCDIALADYPLYKQIMVDKIDGM